MPARMNRTDFEGLFKVVTVNDLMDVEDELATCSRTGHKHLQGDVINLPLDYIRQTEKGAPNGVPELIGGKIPIARIPSSLKEIITKPTIADRDAIEDLFDGLTVLVLDAQPEYSGKKRYTYSIHTGAWEPETDELYVTLDWANIQNRPDVTTKTLQLFYGGPFDQTTVINLPFSDEWVGFCIFPDGEDGANFSITSSGLEIAHIQTEMDRVTTTDFVFYGSSIVIENLDLTSLLPVYVFFQHRESSIVEHSV